MKKIFAVLLAASLLGASLSALADEGYKGRVQVDKKEQIIIGDGNPGDQYMNIDLALKEGLREGAIDFQSPWNCKFSLVDLVQITDLMKQYSFKGSGVGKCLPLTDGYLRIDGSDSKAKVSIYSRSGLVATLNLEKVSLK